LNRSIMEDARSRLKRLTPISLFQEIRQVQRPARMVGLSDLNYDFLFSMDAESGKRILYSLQGGERL
jgi:hypothetical protein